VRDLIPTVVPNPSVATTLGGARSIVGVPMLKDSELVGANVIYRQELRPFTDKQYIWSRISPPRHCHFRGLLRFYACYGPPDRSATQGDLCHEAPVPPVTQRNRPQLPDLSTIIRVEPSSTGDSRLQGALSQTDRSDVAISLAAPCKCGRSSICKRWCSYSKSSCERHHSIFVFANDFDNSVIATAL
jgi:hypothetical protein